jgi:hypothetical protein
MEASFPDPPAPRVFMPINIDDTIWKKKEVKKRFARTIMWVRKAIRSALGKLEGIEPGP